MRQQQQSNNNSPTVQSQCVESTIFVNPIPSSLSSSSSNVSQNDSGYYSPDIIAGNNRNYLNRFNLNSPTSLFVPVLNQSSSPRFDLPLGYQTSFDPNRSLFMTPVSTFVPPTLGKSNKPRIAKSVFRPFEFV
jgi:hypothetical protein